jgi:membrane-bound metal-dependent hydrolase YbcI (DUF457 family)
LPACLPAGLPRIMPITPFHFGPGAALHAIAPRQISFLAFCAVNVVIDVESLYNMVSGHARIHGFVHSVVGATLMIAITCALFRPAWSVMRRVLRPGVVQLPPPTMRAVVFGALLGGYTHVVLDGVMHADMQPFAPFSTANPLLAIIPLGALHLGCAALGVLGLLILFARWFFGIDKPV